MSWLPQSPNNLQDVKRTIGNRAVGISKVWQAKSVDGSGDQLKLRLGQASGLDCRILFAVSWRELELIMDPARQE